MKKIPHYIEKIQQMNKTLVGFCAVAVLFMGSLYYFAAVAFDNGEVLQARQGYRSGYDF